VSGLAYGEEKDVLTGSPAGHSAPNLVVVFVSIHECTSTMRVISHYTMRISARLLDRQAEVCFRLKQASGDIHIQVP
jgi:hypothetical protein